MRIKVFSFVKWDNNDFICSVLGVDETKVLSTAIHERHSVRGI